MRRRVGDTFEWEADCSLGRFDLLQLGMPLN